MKKIWHISDTHTYHSLLTVPENIDIVIFSGDCSNPRDKYANEKEVRDFINWYGKLPIKTKIFVPGNHDTSIEGGLVTIGDFIENDIILLNHSYFKIDGIKIFGSPYTPSFGDGWAFNKARHNLHSLWDSVKTDVDIFITHGPPKYILDSAFNKNHKVDFCGCNALRSILLTKIKPKLVLFGHIHNNEEIINAGVLKLSAYDIIFSNGSVVTDGKFGKLSSNGNILNYEI
jgi:Icc-related predicted phosphoesterase